MNSIETHIIIPIIIPDTIKKNIFTLTLSILYACKIGTINDTHAVKPPNANKIRLRKYDNIKNQTI